MAEYSIMVRGAELKPGLSEATTDKVARELTVGLGRLLGDVKKAMEISPVGGAG